MEGKGRGGSGKGVDIEWRVKEEGGRSRIYLESEGEG